jgi:hypothetical protein
VDALVAPYLAALDEFPLTGTPAAKLRAAVRFAVLAPSSHNSQPWHFQVAGDVVELYADRRRALPVVDPEDRELTISCGAALFNLCLALRHFGFSVQVDRLPGPADLMARIKLGPAQEPTDEDHLLFDAIARRRTNRNPFDDRPVPDALVRALQQAAEREAAWLVPVEGEENRSALAELISEADRFQMASRSFRRELAAWMHPNRTSSRDGMPGYAQGLGDLMSVAAPLVIRTFDVGSGRAAHSRELALGSPLLAVLGTPGDSVRDWLAAGEALEHVLLRAEAVRISASFLNQPIELGGPRFKLTGLIGRGDYPQMLLRMGYGHVVAGTPRRSVEEVLV